MILTWDVSPYVIYLVKEGSLHNEFWGSEGGSALLFKYSDGKNTVGIHSLESCAWICDHLNGWVQAEIF